MGRTRKSPSVRRGTLLRVVSIICLALILLCGGVVTYVYLNFRGLAAGLLRGPVLEKLRTADLPADQKTEIAAVIDRLSLDFRESRLSYSQFAEVFDRLERGPFFLLLDIESAKVRCLQALPATGPERQAATRTLERLQRGLVEGRLSAEKVQDVLSSIRASGPGNDQPLKDALTREEALAVIEKARRETNTANVPADPYAINFAETFRRAALGEAASQPATSPSTQTAPAR